MKTSKFKAGETYRTRNQSIARIYATDGLKGQEIHGATNSETDGWNVATWSEDGRYFSNKTESAWDLMPEIEYWYCVAFVYANGIPDIQYFNSKTQRDQFTSTLDGEFKTFELEKR